MSPIYNMEEAVESGWAQVRSALVEFEGTVVDVVEDSYAPRKDKDGTVIPGKEFLEVKNIDVKVLEVSEDLSMDIDGQDFSFRVNCSKAKNSFWVEKFLASAAELNILLPDGILNKRVTWRKVTQEANNPVYNYTSFVPVGVRDPEELGEETPKAPVNLMEAAADLAVGKTRQQFLSAVSLNRTFNGTEVKDMLEAGTLIDYLISEGLLDTTESKGKTVFVRA